MRLWIFEKPSVAKAVIPHLPGPHLRKDGYVETGDGYVSWLAGHVLELVEPDAYDPALGKMPSEWNLETLPCIPPEWRLQVTEDKAKQVKIVQGLLKKCTSVVNGGDADREGQLLVDELLYFFNNRKPVHRIFLPAMDPASVRKALDTMEDNNDHFPLYQAGLGRQRADWLIGMNMTRAFTVLARRQGYPKVVSVGRVQSPTLALVVARDREIEQFKPKDYWTIEAQFVDHAQSTLPFWTRWLPPGQTLEQSVAEAERANAADDDDIEDLDEDDTAPSAARPAWLDEHHRIVVKAEADRIAAAVRQAGRGTVTRYLQQPVAEQPPMPFDLTKLQVTLNRQHGYSPKAVLDACQALYLAGVTTYPRSDCPFLPEAQHEAAPDVLAAVAQGCPALAALAQRAQPALKSRAWNDGKVGEHHGLIPTRQAPNFSALSPIEQHAYETIARQYVAQFYPDCLVDKAKIEVTIAQERFVANGRVVKDPGWRVVFGANPGQASVTSLPVLAEQQSLTCQNVKQEAKKTKAPPRYTKGSLLGAMKHVHLHVTDPVERKKLKALEGIGRAATRASIIETLILRMFVREDRKELISTSMGRLVIDALPPKLIDPGMTARWETLLDGIASNQVPLDAFMGKQATWITNLIDAIRQTTLPPIPVDAMEAATSAMAQKYGGKSAGSSKSGTAARSSNASRANAKAPPGATPCPACGKGHLVERTVGKGEHMGKKFFSCSRYPDCKHSAWPKS